MFINLIFYVGIKTPKSYVPLTGEQHDILESETNFLVSSIEMLN